MKANKCKNILFKSEDFHTGKIVPVYCGMIASDWDGNNPTILLCDNCRKSFIEVIGNIYENPSLNSIKEGDEK